MVHLTEFLRRAKRLVSLFRHFVYDFWRYVSHSSVSGCSPNREQIAGRLVAQYHALEKGLSLTNPRPAFGEYHLLETGRLLDRWKALGLPVDLLEYQAAQAALVAYREHHQKIGVALPPHLQAVVDLHATEGLGSVLGGRRQLRREQIAHWQEFDFDRFVNTRHSVRSFTTKPVGRGFIEAVIRQAQRSPSVCNRQTSRVYVLSDQAGKLAALQCQNGNRGFREEIDTLLIVTTKLHDFCDPSERNQGFIDSGMFAMTLLLALHAKGLGACPLNWSATVEEDLALRRAVPIKSEENVIMMIAVGHLPEQFMVATSARLPLERIAYFL